MGKMAASQSRGLQGPRSCGVPGLRGGGSPCAPLLCAGIQPVGTRGAPAGANHRPQPVHSPGLPRAGTWQPPNPTVYPGEPPGSLNCLSLNIAGPGAAPASRDPGHGAVTQQSGQRRNGGGRRGAPRRHLNSLCSLLTRGQRPPPCLPAPGHTKTTAKLQPIPPGAEGHRTGPAVTAIAGVAAVSPHSRHLRRGRTSPAQRWDAAAPGAPHTKGRIASGTALFQRLRSR